MRKCFKFSYFMLHITHACICLLQCMCVYTQTITINHDIIFQNIICTFGTRYRLCLGIHGQSVLRPPVDNYIWGMQNIMASAHNWSLVLVATWACLRSAEAARGLYRSQNASWMQPEQDSDRIWESSDNLQSTPGGLNLQIKRTHL